MVPPPPSSSPSSVPVCNSPIVSQRRNRLDCTCSRSPLKIYPSARRYASSGTSAINCSFRALKFSSRRKGGGGTMDTRRNNLTPSDHLRHVESMSTLPSGAGKISHLNAVILGESLASEENDLVFPSHEFCRTALVPSPEKVAPFYFLSIFITAVT